MSEEISRSLESVQKYFDFQYSHPYITIKVVNNIDMTHNFIIFSNQINIFANNAGIDYYLSFQKSFQRKSCFKLVYTIPVPTKITLEYSLVEHP